MHERADINAQVIKLMILLNISDNKPDKSLIENCIMHLLKFQTETVDKVADGSFIYGFDDDGRKKNDPNSWVTMFSVQALYMYMKNIAKGDDFNPYLLI